MKKVFVVLCMAVLAGGMIFTSCTKSFTITVTSNNDAWGTVSGGGTYAMNAEAVLKATPAEGYEFEKWNDGNTESTRVITVTANESYVAYFKAVTPDPGPGPQPQVGEVKVTFNNEVWDASTISGRWLTNYQFWDVYAMETSNSFPIADVATGIMNGSQSATAESQYGELDGDFQWVEYYYETYLQDNSGNYYGDFWAKNVTCNVTAFDATALTLTSNVSATMFSAYEAFVDGVGVDAASTAPMTVNINAVSLTSAKGSLKKKGAKNLVAVK
jgi:hypothetical protein